MALAALGLSDQPLRLLNTETAVLIGMVYSYLPFMVLPLYATLEKLDRSLLEAAADLGATPLRAFLTVTLPLCLPGILAGMILCFAKAMGEFGATITFVSNIPGETQTLPSAIYTFTQVPGGEAGATRLTLISIAISVSALFASEALARLASRRVGAA